MDHLCDILEIDPVQNELDMYRGFLWDNHIIYKTTYVTYHISSRQLRKFLEGVDMPSYMPNIAPIEYVI